MNHKQEKTGEIFILSQVILFSIFPIIMSHTTKLMPPLLFAALTTLISSFFFFIHLVYTNKIKEIFNKKALKYCILVTLLIVVIPSILIFKGTKLTSGINTAIFLQMEILFALPICAILIKEKITKIRLISNLIIALGAILVLYNGSLQLNKGDLLIIAGTIIYPFGNIYAQKALKIISPSAALLFRSFLGGSILLLISLIFENSSHLIVPSIKEHFWAIVVSGILVMGLSKWLWYQGLKRLDVTKATALAMTYPAFSLIIAVIFTNEKATLYQVLGLAVMMFGIYLSTSKDKKSHRKAIEFIAPN